MAKSRFLNAYLYLAAAMALLISMTNMLGWHLELPAFVQILAGTVPMMYNTALVLFLCAVSLLTATGDGIYNKISVALAALVLVLSIITGLQYIVGLDFGIDRFFIDPYKSDDSGLVFAKTSYPGRMAPITIICFILLSVAVLRWFPVGKMSASKDMTMICAFFVVVLTLSALAGYFFDFEFAYGWWGLSDIAFQTALGLFFIATGILAFAFLRNESMKAEGMSVCRPVCVATAGILITLAISQITLQSGQQRMKDRTRAEAVRIAGLLEYDLTNSIAALERVGNWWLANMPDTASIEQWRMVAGSYVKNQNSFYAMALTGPDFKILQTVVPENNLAFWDDIALDRDVLDAAATEENLLYARRLGVNAGTEPMLKIYFPLRSEGRFYGLIMAAYSLQKGLQTLLDVHESDTFEYEIYDDDGLLLSNIALDDRALWEEAYEKVINVSNVTLRARVAQDVSGYESSGLVFLIFITGVGMSLLLARFIQKTEAIRIYTKELEKSDRLYSLVVEGADIALWDWDIEKGLMVWGGQAWKLFGVEANEDVPCNEADVRALIPDEDNEEIDKVIFNDLKQGDSFTVEFRLRHAHGRYIWVSSRGKAIKRAGDDVLRAVGIFMDVTERKEYEAQLKRTNEELEQFAYIASHDLKAPLRGIDNLAKWIEEDLQDTIPDDAREKIELMRGRVFRLEMLLEDILQYSRAGRIVDEPVDIDTGDLVRQVADSLGLPKGFEIHIPDDMPALTAPYTPLNQIFLNLISNAYKHHDRKNGKIDIQVRDKGLFYEFIVADDGPGVPEEFQERVFKMFQTLQSRDKKEGSGLGMSIVKKLVEWQGGKVWITSKDGQRGTEIHFLWPKNIKKAEKKDVA